MAAAVFGMLLLSCERREFVPQTGNTPIQFQSAQLELSLTGEYIFVPIQMVEPSTVAAKAIVEFKGGTLTTLDGATKDVVEFTNDAQGYERGGDIIITSNEIYIGGMESEDDTTGIPTGNLEVRIPDYRNIQQITLNFELVGEYPQGITTTTVVATRPEAVPIAGTYTVTSTFTDAEIPPYSFTVELDESDPTRCWFINLEGAGTTSRSIYGTINGNVVTIANGQTIQDPLYEGMIIGIKDEQGFGYGADPVLEFSFEGITFTNGFWVGAISGNQITSIATVINSGDFAARN